MHRLSGPAGTFPFSTEKSSYARTSVIEILPLQFQENDAHPMPFTTECGTTTNGSLFSIHSAPPVPLTEMVSNVQNSSSVGFEIGGSGSGTIGIESPRRPISLAIDMQYHSAKTISVFQHLPSEIEEDDNENMLTVSSLTARPLIAKSHELRTTK